MRRDRGLLASGNRGRGHRRRPVWKGAVYRLSSPCVAARHGAGALASGRPPAVSPRLRLEMTSLPAFPRRSGAPVRDKLRAAVIGAGAWAPRHVEAIRRTGIGEVPGLAGRRPARVRVAAARLAVERARVNAKDVLEDPMVDVIHICTPNDSHAPLAHAAIAAAP